MAMARRSINPSRRSSESRAAPFASSLRSRSSSHPYLPTALIFVGGFLLIGYFYRDRGYPHHEKAKVVDKAKHGWSAKLRSSIWWIRYFVQTSLEENEAVIKKFEQAAVKSSYTSNCQIFHLNSYR